MATETKHVVPEATLEQVIDAVNRVRGLRVEEKSSLMVLASSKTHKRQPIFLLTQAFFKLSEELNELRDLAAAKEREVDVALGDLRKFE